MMRWWGHGSQCWVAKLWRRAHQRQRQCIVVWVLAVQVSNGGSESREGEVEKKKL